MPGTSINLVIRCTMIITKQLIFVGINKRPIPIEKKTFSDTKFTCHFYDATTDSAMFSIWSNFIIPTNVYLLFYSYLRLLMDKRKKSNTSVASTSQTSESWY